MNVCVQVEIASSFNLPELFPVNGIPRLVPDLRGIVSWILPNYVRPDAQQAD